MDNADLELLVTDLTTDPDANVDDWARAVEFGFNGKQLTDKQLARLNEVYRREGRRIRGFYRETREGAMPGPVATFGSYDGTINTGGGHLEPANFITDVTVRPSHRRRGLLRTLMTTDLTAAKERGQVFATLTATEATIYGRFGFGAATQHLSIQIDTKRGMKLRHEPAGTLDVIDPSHPSTIGARERLHAQIQATRRGAHSRSWAYEDDLAGIYNFEEDGPNRKMRAVAHYSASGELDGIAGYKVEDWSKAKVVDVLALDANAQLGLWNFLGNLDLVEELTFHGDDPATPLPWALVDSRQYDIKGVKDCIWLRVLDSKRALQSRGWDHDGSLVLQIDDAMDLAGGRFALTVEGGTANVTESTADPDVTLTVETLGSLYFGLVSPLVMAQAGRIQGTTEAVATLNTLFAVDLAPYNMSHF